MANNLTAPPSSGAGAITPGAIVGDTSAPYEAAALAAGDSLTTGDLALGDAGEAGGLNDFSVEIWVRFNAGIPSINTVLLGGPECTSGALEQWGLVFDGSSQAAFSAVNAAGATVYSGSAPLMAVGTWYHLVGVVTGGNIRVYQNGVDAGGAAFSGPIRPASFAAGASAMQVLYAGGTNMHVDELAIYRTGLSAARVLAHYNAGVNRGLRTQGPGERIGAVLDAYTSTAPRSIQTGTRNVTPVYFSGQSPLSEAQHAVEAEDVDAAFFAKADGTLTFLADGHRSSSPYNTSQVTVGDAGGAEIPYESLSVDYSETYLINEWNVTRTAYGVDVPVTQTVSDAGSISKYFKRSQSLSDVPTTNDTNAGNIATALLAKYKDPMLRVTEVTFNLSDPSVAEAVLRRELMDRITVKRTPPGGGSRIDQTLYIQKIELSASNDGQPWKVRWGVSPL